MIKILVLHRAIAITASPESRACGSCSACCKTHKVSDTRFVKEPGVWCQFCVKGQGCRIYEERPSACKAFYCEWHKGAGEEKHRPDRTKVVLDFVSDPQGLPGGVLQMWEVTEGTLTQAYAKEVSLETLGYGIWVSHFYLSGRKRLFTPPSRLLTEEIIEVATKEGIVFGTLHELEAAR